MDNRFEAFNDAEKMPEGLQFLTYEEVARIFKVRRATIRSWVWRGLIRTNIRMGRKSLIPLIEVRRFAAERAKVNEKLAFGRERTKPEKVVPPPSETPESLNPNVPADIDSTETTN